MLTTCTHAHTASLKKKKKKIGARSRERGGGGGGGGGLLTPDDLYHISDCRRGGDGGQGRI